MKKEIAKAYCPQSVEEGIYKAWEESGFFNPDNLPCVQEGTCEGKFVISMPPPNATGVLHIGHGCRFTYQDLMTRFNRLCGKQALWLPGTDHASIATQTKVEKIIAKEGLNKYDLGREKFLERVHGFVKNSQDTIRNQVRRMGSSCDWSRERYTLDEGLSEVVRQVFVMMYEDGLVYRGDRVVNWCPRCESTIADDEVEHEEVPATLYFFRYSKDFPIVIATTRPETKLGDTAVAVNPKDERYKEFIGKSYTIDLGNGPREIKIISDWEVDMTFGTGALGVTPAHSLTDFKMAKENELPVIKVIGEDGRMTEAAGEAYTGLTTVEAREKIVQYFRTRGLMEKEEETKQNLSVCYRCDTPIEPLPSLQWFVDVNKKIGRKGNKYFPEDNPKSLKEVMLEVVRSGDIKIIPERFNKVYFSWVENLGDWCISRQLWFGHRIPVSYCKDCGQVIVRTADIEKCPKCGSTELREETDTLDTWFSSGTWTFSTLMDRDFSKYKDFEEWKAGSPDLAKFHPTTVLETAYDLIFFWVARMILMTTYAIGQVPFENVYFGGLVRDKEGRKMSKSLGNGIDPIEMIDKFGTDALRLSYVIGATPGNDLKVYEEKIETYRNFINKVWNISRYILMSVEDVHRVGERPQAKTFADEWILGELDYLVADVKDNLANYRFSPAGEQIYDFTWSKFADWYLEVAKVEGDKSEILLYVLERLLVVLHPFAPFVTEELWKNFETDSFLMVEKWPDSVVDINELERIRKKFEVVKGIIIDVRNYRAEHNIPYKTKIKKTVIFYKEASVIDGAVTFITKADNNQEDRKLIEDHAEIIKSMLKIETLEITDDPSNREEMTQVSLYPAIVYCSKDDSIDTTKEKEKLIKDKENLEKFIHNLKAKLENETFTAKAPANIIAQEKQKLLESEERLVRVEEKLNFLL
jgi:valyl-tRNA synthetase